MQISPLTFRLLRKMPDSDRMDESIYKLRSKMPEPKKQSSPRKTGLRRSHLRLELARRVNKTSPVKVFETKKKTPNLKVKTVKGKEV